MLNHDQERRAADGAAPGVRRGRQCRAAPPRALLRGQHVARGGARVRVGQRRRRPPRGGATCSAARSFSSAAPPSTRRRGSAYGAARAGQRCREGGAQLKKPAAARVAAVAEAPAEAPARRRRRRRRRWRRRSTWRAARPRRVRAAPPRAEGDCRQPAQLEGESALHLAMQSNTPAHEDRNAAARAAPPPPQDEGEGALHVAARGEPRPATAPSAKVAGGDAEHARLLAAADSARRRLGARRHAAVAHGRLKMATLPPHPRCALDATDARGNTAVHLATACKTCGSSASCSPPPPSSRHATSSDGRRSAPPPSTAARWRRVSFDAHRPRRAHLRRPHRSNRGRRRRNLLTVEILLARGADVGHAAARATAPPLPPPRRSRAPSPSSRARPRASADVHGWSAVHSAVGTATASMTSAPSATAAASTRRRKRPRTRAPAAPRRPPATRSTTPRCPRPRRPGTPSTRASTSCGTTDECAGDSETGLLICVAAPNPCSAPAAKRSQCIMRAQVRVRAGSTRRRARRSSRPTAPDGPRARSATRSLTAVSFALIAPTLSIPSCCSRYAGAAASSSSLRARLRKKLPSCAGGGGGGSGWHAVGADIHPGGGGGGGGAAAPPCSQVGRSRAMTGVAAPTSTGGSGGGGSRGGRCRRCSNRTRSAAPPAPRAAAGAAATPSCWRSYGRNRGRCRNRATPARPTPPRKPARGPRPPVRVRSAPARPAVAPAARPRPARLRTPQAAQRSRRSSEGVAWRRSATLRSRGVRAAGCAAGQRLRCRWSRRGAH